MKGDLHALLRLYGQLQDEQKVLVAAVNYLDACLPDDTGARHSDVLSDVTDDSVERVIQLLSERLEKVRTELAKYKEEK